MRRRYNKTPAVKRVALCLCDPDAAAHTVLVRRFRAVLTLSLALSCSGGDEDSSGTVAEPGVPPGTNDDEAAAELIAHDDADGAGAAAECARDSYRAERALVNVYLLLDISGSMRLPIAVDSELTQWDAVRVAVEGFIASPESAGLELALNYFPALGARTDCDELNNCAAAVSCILRICDLSYFLFGDVIPCSLDLQCGLQATTVDGQTITESCAQPGRCSNAPLEMCFGDLDCAAGGQCVVAEGGLCPGEMSCDPAQYEAPAVPLTRLPDPSSALVESLAAHEPDTFGRTPTQVALDGAYRQVAEWQRETPTTRSVVVLATDGGPIGCNGLIAPAQDELLATEQTLDAIAAARSDGISTYVIGVVPDLSGLAPADQALVQPELAELEAKLSQMAERGGTERSFNVTANDTTTDAFSGALASIRGQVLPCDYEIPVPETGVVNFGQLNVEVTGSEGGVTIPKVNAADECTAGEDAWHYDTEADGAAPNRVILCPSTCERVESGQLERVDIVLGCVTVEKAR